MSHRNLGSKSICDLSCIRIRIYQIGLAAIYLLRFFYTAIPWQFPEYLYRWQGALRFLQTRCSGWIWCQIDLIISKLFICRLPVFPKLSPTAADQYDRRNAKHHSGYCLYKSSFVSKNTLSGIWSFNSKYLSHQSAAMTTKLFFLDPVFTTNRTDRRHLRYQLGILTHYKIHISQISDQDRYHRNDMEACAYLKYKSKDHADNSAHHNAGKQSGYLKHGSHPIDNAA